MQTTLVSASSDRVGFLPPEQDLAAAVVVAALADLRRRHARPGRGRDRQSGD